MNGGTGVAVTGEAEGFMVGLKVVERQVGLKVLVDIYVGLKVESDMVDLNVVSDIVGLNVEGEQVGFVVEGTFDEGNEVVGTKLVGEGRNVVTIGS